jgi:SAM-dependent methyltransferase
MASPVSLIPYIFPQIEGSTILDVGCGEGIYGFLLQNLWYQTRAAEIFPRQKKPKLLVGLDVKGGLKDSKLLKNIYDKIVICSAKKLPFPNKSFDTVLCIEVIEHLEQKDVPNLLEEMDRVAKKQIILSTPKDPLNKRFLPYGGKYPNLNWPMPDRHKSQISFSELKQRGYFLLYSPLTYGFHPFSLIKFVYLKFFSDNFIVIKKLNH